MSFNACDIKVLMLLNLLLAGIRIWSGIFFFFVVVLSNFLMIAVDKEKPRVKLALTIPTGAPIKLVKEK